VDEALYLRAEAHKQRPAAQRFRTPRQRPSRPRVGKVRLSSPPETGIRPGCSRGEAKSNAEAAVGRTRRAREGVQAMPAGLQHLIGQVHCPRVPLCPVVAAIGFSDSYRTSKTTRWARA
jgi:hypothetical protein